MMKPRRHNPSEQQPRRGKQRDHRRDEASASAGRREEAPDKRDKRDAPPTKPRYNKNGRPVLNVTAWRAENKDAAKTARDSAPERKSYRQNFSETPARAKNQRRDKSFGGRTNVNRNRADANAKYPTDRSRTRYPKTSTRAEHRDEAKTARRSPLKKSYRQNFSDAPAGVKNQRRDKSFGGRTNVNRNRANANAKYPTDRSRTRYPKTSTRAEHRDEAKTARRSPLKKSYRQNFSDAPAGAKNQRRDKSFGGRTNVNRNRTNTNGNRIAEPAKYPTDRPQTRYAKNQKPHQRPARPTERRTEKQTKYSGTKTAAGEKIQKILADGGMGSRRQMETLIEDGHVTVNGKTVQLGARATASDKIYIDGTLLVRDTYPRRLLLYNKPVGKVVSREEDGDIVFDDLPPVTGCRWINIGRLDINSEGLLLFSTDGAWVNYMTHPRNGVEREYRARASGQLTEEIMTAACRDGVAVDKLAPLKPRRFVLEHASNGQNCWYRIVLTEGRNRAVRRLFAHYGLEVSRLIRIRYGSYRLPVTLRRGEWREAKMTTPQQP